MIRFWWWNSHLPKFLIVTTLPWAAGTHSNYYPDASSRYWPFPRTQVTLIRIKPESSSKVSSAFQISWGAGWRWHICQDIGKNSNPFYFRPHPFSTSTSFSWTMGKFGVLLAFLYLSCLPAALWRGLPLFSILPQSLWQYGHLISPPGFRLLWTVHDRAFGPERCAVHRIVLLNRTCLQMKGWARFIKVDGIAYNFLGSLSCSGYFSVSCTVTVFSLWISVLTSLWLHKAYSFYQRVQLMWRPISSVTQRRVSHILKALC